MCLHSPVIVQYWPVFFLVSIVTARFHLIRCPVRSGLVGLRSVTAALRTGSYTVLLFVLDARARHSSSAELSAEQTGSHTAKQPYNIQLIKKRINLLMPAKEHVLIGTCSIICVHRDISCCYEMALKNISYFLIVKKRVISRRDVLEGRWSRSGF